MSKLRQGLYNPQEGEGIGGCTDVGVVYQQELDLIAGATEREGER